MSHQHSSGAGASPSTTASAGTAASPSTETFSWTEAAELAVVQRSGFVESRHIGAAAMVGPQGQLLEALGSVTAPVFPRSALKPFQAIASMKGGAPLFGAEVALAAGSHTGSFEHMRTAAGMLESAELTPDDLQCPAAYPQDRQARTYLLAHDKPPQALAMNCSGKHAAFLWACAASGWDTATYLDPQHPLQRLVLEVIEEFTDEAPAAVGTDGCGAPVAAVTLEGMARGYARLGAAIRNITADARAATLATAMVDYPEMVQGHGTANTVVSEELDLIAKFGAEGILCLGTPAGAGVAVKVLDGSTRAATLVGLTLLVRHGFLEQAAVEAVLEKVQDPVLGGGQPVGAIGLGAAFAAPAAAGTPGTEQ